MEQILLTCIELHCEQTINFFNVKFLQVWGCLLLQLNTLTNTLNEISTIKKENSASENGGPPQV
jgi:hypothetical protein